jgi:magnesium transporter
MNYLTNIRLEVHLQLKPRSKIFCGILKPIDRRVAERAGHRFLLARRGPPEQGAIMFKRRRHVVPGEAPGLLKLSQESSKEPPIITLIEYGPDCLEERKNVDCDELLPHLNNDLVTWINIDGLGDLSVLRILGERFNLHPLALEDVLDTGQRPKVEQYDDYLFIVAKMLYLDKDKKIGGEQVSMFLGKTFLITLQEEPERDVFEPIRARIRSGKGRIRKAASDYLAYALLDSIIDHYYPVLESIGAEIDIIEDELIDSPLLRPVGSLHEHKRTLTQIRRMVWPLRDVTNLLLHEEPGLIRSETKIYLRDCYDHSVQLMDVVESYRDVLSGLTEVHISSIGLRTNEIMRVLTVITVIFIPLTFIAGVYGMNFSHMPELNKPYGYGACLLLMLFVAVGQILYFKKRRWL